MYEYDWYNVYFTMNTPDNKTISEMSYSELYWVLKTLDQFKEAIEAEVRERREVLYDENRKRELDILMEKYLPVIQKGTGRKSRKADNEALNVLLDIYFHKIE